MSKLRVLLVRHGESRANTDWKENRRVADHAIGLTDRGVEQAKEAGKFLAQWFRKKIAGAPIEGRIIVPQIRMWYSPYVRARQTADQIWESCTLDLPAHGRGPRGTRKAGDSWFIDKREKLHLHEQQFGLFDGLSDDERAEVYPDMQAYYEKCKEHEGKMWPQMPMGESRVQVCLRVHQAFGSFHRDHDKHGIGTIVVVAHGTVNRAFVQMWCHKPWEWMHEEPNPANCSIRLLEHGEDKGYIFEGFAQ